MKLAFPPLHFQHQHTDHFYPMKWMWMGSSTLCRIYNRLKSHTWEIMIKGLIYGEKSLESRSPLPQLPKSVRIKELFLHDLGHLATESFPAMFHELLSTDPYLADELKHIWSPWLDFLRIHLASSNLRFHLILNQIIDFIATPLWFLSETNVFKEVLVENQNKIFLSQKKKAF